MRSTLLLIALSFVAIPDARAQIYGALPYPGDYRIMINGIEDGSADVTASAKLPFSVAGARPIVNGVRAAGGDYRGDLYVPVQATDGDLQLWATPYVHVYDTGRVNGSLWGTALLGAFQANATAFNLVDGPKKFSASLGWRWPVLNLSPGLTYTEGAGTSYHVAYRLWLTGRNWLQGRYDLETGRFSVGFRAHFSGLLAGE